MQISSQLFATPPNGWIEKQICKIIGAKTFHWGWLIMPIGNDFATSESIGKGTTVSRLAGRKAFIYRVKDLPIIDSDRIIDIHSQYGEWQYDWQVAILTAIWWLCKHYLGIIIPVIKDKKVNCQEWVCLIACELGIKLIPDNEYPECINLENSPYLEFERIANE